MFTARFDQVTRAIGSLCFPNVRSCSRGLCLAVILCLVAVTSWAAILNVPSLRYPTIQAAINAAVSGADTVVVADGTYTGSGNTNLSFLGKSIRVQSLSGDPANCIIDAQGADDVCGFAFYSGESNASVLDGFTIMNGGTSGIYIWDSSPTIQNCIISDNHAGDPDVGPGFGGGIAIGGASSPDISDCVITRNHLTPYHMVTTGGGGVYSESHTAVLRNCVISDNYAFFGDGGGFFGNATIIDCDILSNSADGAGYSGVGAGGGLKADGASLSGCVIAGNWATWSGGGLEGDQGSPCTITGCTVVGNRCRDEYGDGGGGLMVRTQTSLTRTIVWGNCADNGVGDDIATSDNLTLTCCCVNPLRIEGPVTFDGPQVYGNPLFCDPKPCTEAPTSEGNYTLQCTSPCAPENNPDCGLIGALEVGCDPQGFSDFDPARGSRLRLEIEPIGIGLGSVSIRYCIPEALRPNHVRLDVFDVGGCLVKTVLDEPARPGHALVRWDETDESGRPVACGSYYCSLIANGQRAVRAFVIIR